MYGKIVDLISSARENIKRKSFYLNPNTLFVLAVLPLATVLAFIYLGDKSLWNDEAFSAAFAQMDWGEFWPNVFRYEANQGLYYLLLHLWVNLGNSEFILRSLSVIFALGSVIVVFLFGRHLFEARTGLIAALLIMINGFFIAYAQEARAYMLALFLSTLSSYFFVKSIEKSGWKWWGVYVLCSVLGVYAHIYTILILLAHFISLLFLSRREIPWKGVITAGISMVLLSVPLLLFILTGDIGQVGWISKPQLKEVAWLFSQLSGRGGWLLSLVNFILGIIALFFTIRTYLYEKLSLNFWRRAFLLCWLFIPISFAFLFSYAKPIFVPRYFIIVLPALILIVAFGLSQIKPRLLIYGTIVLLVVLSSLSLREWYTGDEDEYTRVKVWREVTHDITTSDETGDAIIFFIPSLIYCYDYYLDRFKVDDAPTVVYYLPIPEESLNPYYLPEGFDFHIALPQPERSILDQLSGHKRVWLVLGHLSDEGKEQGQVLKSYIQEKYDLIEEKAYYTSTRVFLFKITKPLTQ